jgi:hypothetical protein
MRNNIEGFDYRTGTSVVKSIREWKADTREIVAKGGKRRVENGETFVSIKTPERMVLAFEIYANVPA